MICEKIIPVSRLRIGQRVDLEKDSVADNGEHPEFEFEFEVVEGLIKEGDDTIVVVFESGLTFGFPIGHKIKVDPQQD